MIPAQPPESRAIDLAVLASPAASPAVQALQTLPPPSAYYIRLHPWCIIRHWPNLQHETIARFRSCNQAEAHLKALRQLTPALSYSIMFDSP